MSDESTSALRRWDPFRNFDLLTGWPGWRGIPLAPAAGEGLPGRWAPSVDVSESDDEYVVTVELAGANRDDVTVEVNEGVLTIRGEKRNEREEKQDQRRYVERTYGSFTRSFSLPANANGDAIKARFQNGVLSIEIPKREEKKPKAIAIH